MKIKIILPALLLLSSLLLFTAWQSTDWINGCITDSDGEPLIGASVLIKGTTRGTVTDIDGCFRIAAPAGEVVLVVSYTGFDTKEITTKVGDELAIKLDEGVSLDEVVVTGASSPRRIKRNAVSAVSRSERKEASPPPPPPPPAVYEEVPASADAPMSIRRVRSEEAYEAPIEATSFDSFVDAEVTSKSVPDHTVSLSAGQLTAGEVNDFSKWEMWSDISQEDLERHRGEWLQYADHRYTLQLTNGAGFPVVNAIVHLRDGQGNTLWTARTDVTGKAELWAHFFQETAQAANGLEIRGEYQGITFRIDEAKPYREGINFYELAADCRENPQVDIAFVVDATGSMRDEIAYLQAELLDVVGRVQDSLPMADIQLGSVFYRDHGEEYIVRVKEFSPVFDQTVNFIQNQMADGGGDTPEAVEEALKSTLNHLQWRDEASTRLLFLVLDAPPRQTAETVQRMQELTAKTAAMGIRIIPISCSGIDKSTEYLMRALALATNGTYTFLTDHSGIGNSHIEPSTGSYEVEHLNDLMVRLIVQFSTLSNCTPPIVLEEEETPLPPRIFESAITAHEANWNYYPNPTAGPLRLEFEGPGGDLYLADAHGKLLQRFTETNTRQDLNLGNYPAGSYWLRYEDEEGQWSQGRVLVVRR